MASASRLNIRSLPLLHKILLPFFLILTILGAGATVVSVLLITKAIYKTADERLTAFHQVVFRHIKRQEYLLGTCAELYQYSLTNGPPQAAPALPERMEKTLQEFDIQAHLYPASSLDAVADEAGRELLEQALRSGKPRFRFTAELGPVPALTLAAPLRLGNNKPAVLLLQTPMDSAFLKKLAAPFHTEVFLFAADGQPLSGTDQGHEHPVLTPQQQEQLLSGGTVLTTTADPLPHRHLYSAVPLGTTDIVFVSSELPMADLRTLVKTMATGSVLAITVALLLGGYAYFRLIRQIMSPVEELQLATRAVSDGNLDYRLPPLGRGEFGQLATAFNEMMSQLETLYREKLEQERVLSRAQGELRYKEALEQKNREIEQANREMKAHLRELSALFQVNQAVTSTLDLNVLFDRILQLLKEAIHCQEMVLLLYNPGAEELEIRKAYGIDHAAIKGVAFRLEEGISGEAAREQKLIYVSDVAEDDRYLNYKGKNRGRGSMVAAPLVVKSRLLGVLNLHKEAVGAFTDTEIKLIQAIVSQAAIAIENAQLYEKAKNLSNTDELTGLANRRYFQEILTREAAQARRYGTGFSVIMADIDHFKLYNDTHGHLRGDTVLRKVAAILLQNTRGIDLVGRFGGEEFVILLPKTNKDGGRAAAEKLRLCVAGEIFAGADKSQPEGYLSLSLGVAEFPSDSKDVYDLIDLADKALYAAKQAGRNRTVAWNDEAPLPPHLPPPSMGSAP